MTRSRSRALRVLTAGVLIAPAAACGNDGTGPDVEVPAHYALANVGGAWPDQTTYLQTLPELRAGTIDNRNATELARSGTLWQYNGAVYVYTFGAPAAMTKYTPDAQGRLNPGAQLVTPGANTYSTLQFISPTRAYASVAGGLAKLIRFDPSTMQATGEVDLSSLARPAANSLWYIGSHVRDGKLFLAVDYQHNFDAVYDSAFIAVIDLASEQVERVISDGRTAMIFAAGATVKAFVEDGNGDIYVQARGNRDAGGNAPSGVLRIRRGETRFDPDYFFDLDAALGGPGYGLAHFAEDGLSFTFRAMDPDDRWDFDGPNHRLYRIDLRERSVIGPVAGLPLTTGSNLQIIRKFEPGRLHVAISSANEDAVYAYDIAAGTTSRLITMTGGRITGLERLE